jgi:hypothetical protein
MSGLRFRLTELALRFLQRHDIHVMRTRFDNPVPDTNRLADDTRFWQEPRALPGIELRLEEQLALTRALSAYAPECAFPDRPAGPHDYWTHESPSFGLLSATALHGIIRHHAPKLFLEIGSGNSTLVAARAARFNAADGKHMELMAIDPFAGEQIRSLGGGFRLITEQVQNLPLDRFAALGDGDVLFIDSSHVVVTGNDVTFLFLEVLPRLRPGVLVHVHDIFFPFDYPKKWIVNNRWYWNEQYLLQAFLALNDAYQVIWCESLLKHAAPVELERCFPGFTRPEVNGDSNSFWMRRVR